MLAAPERITDIPHLDVLKSRSVISFLAGDLSTPAVGIRSKKDEEGLLLFGIHRIGERYTGWEVREDLEREELVLSYSYPGVREETRYFFGEREDGTGFYPHCDRTSKDEGRIFEAGEAFGLPLKLFWFEAKEIADLFQVFQEKRDCLEQAGALVHKVPFSEAYRVIKEKYQRENLYRGSQGSYYTVGVRRDTPLNHWQAGWVGGGMNNLPFLLEAEGEIFDRGLDTFRFVMDHLQFGNGWVTGIYAEGKCYGDAFEQTGGDHVLLVRKDADLLYFLLKERELIAGKSDGEGRKLLRKKDEEGIQKLCDAFVRFYHQYGQLGQFIDIQKEIPVVAGSASAAMAPGALALAYEVYGKEEYLQTAECLGRDYAENYLKKGIVNGGPGEILQAPDSESSFALLESYVQLYETTGKAEWLSLAEESCDLAMSWVMNYDFVFPADRTAAKRKVQTAGTVFANAQNKHSAPGICTLSGNSLLKMYRFTGEDKYLDWLEKISHSLTQFVSLKEDPEPTLEGPLLKEGYINERVQTSDWEGEETVGEFLNGSNWPEVTMLLTYVEVPGIYLDQTRKKVKVFDHVDCVRAVWTEDNVELTVYNPTRYAAEVTILTDRAGKADAGKKGCLGAVYFDRMEKVMVDAGKESTVRIRLN